VEVCGWHADQVKGSFVKSTQTFGTLVLVDECQDRASLSSIVSRAVRGSLPLGVNHVRELHQACEAMGDNLHWDVHDDFIIAPEGM
jgi:hypothetical protein